MSPTDPTVVVVFTAKERNSAVIADALDAGGIGHIVCESLASFRERVATDIESAGALLLTERALALDARDVIVEFQDNEPIWSELPVVLLSSRDRPPSWAQPLRNVILVRQPTSPRQLRSVVHLALEVRGHQLEVHDLLLRLEEQHDWSEMALVYNQQRLAREEISREDLERKLAIARRRLNRRREEDRLMLARELHDNIIQRLLYVSMRLAPGEGIALEAGISSLQEMIEEVRQDTHLTVKELRRLIRELRPAGLELGFEAALKPTIARLAPTVDVKSDVEQASELPDDAVLCLYRVAQEALRNVERHADAESVRVAVRRYRDEAHLFVADDGRGFDVPNSLTELAHEEHFGLLGAQEFVEGLGGDLKIRSVKGKGTCLRARLPLHQPRLRAG